MLAWNGDVALPNEGTVAERNSVAAVVVVAVTLLPVAPKAGAGFGGPKIDVAEPAEAPKAGLDAAVG